GGRGAAVESPPLVRAREAAAAESSKEHVLTTSEHDEIRDSIPIDVDGIRAVDAGEVGHGTREANKAERPARRAVVPIERGGPAPAGEIQVGPPVAVAVECGHTPADRVLEAAAVRVIDAGA